MISRIWAITKKELKQMRRDVRTLLIVFIFPIFMLVLFGYALNFDVSHVKVGVYDQDKSPLSREFIHSLESSGYFDVVTYFENQDEINKALDSKQVQSAIVIPKDLSDKFYSKQNAKIQYLVDGVDGNTATIVMSYLNAATRNLSQRYSKEVLERVGFGQYVPVNLEPVFWFNPELKTTQFLVPGLVAALLMTLSVVLTAIAIVREYELGTIEQINVSPVSAIELLLGKIIPYAIVSLLIAFLIIAAGYFLFAVPAKGSFFLLLITILLYLFSGLSIGIVVSAISDTQQVAFQIGLMFSQLPSQLLSGFIFPIESMPKAVQILTNITPSKFFLVALRSILIKGTGIAAFWDQLIYLVIFILVFLSLATLIMKKRRVQ
jgi:ABC-2 type transport system permease protein